LTQVYKYNTIKYNMTKELNTQLKESAHAIGTVDYELDLINL